MRQQLGGSTSSKDGDAQLTHRIKFIDGQLKRSFARIRTPPRATSTHVDGEPRELLLVPVSLVDGVGAAAELREHRVDMLVLDRTFHEDARVDVALVGVALEGGAQDRRGGQLQRAPSLQVKTQNGRISPACRRAAGKWRSFEAAVFAAE